MSWREDADLGLQFFDLAVRKWNLGQYLLGAVGLVAGVAVILRLASGDWKVPLIGAPILFVLVALIIASGIASHQGFLFLNASPQRLRLSAMSAHLLRLVGYDITMPTARLQWRPHNRISTF